MASANPDPFSGVLIGSGPMSVPQIVTNIPISGPSTGMKNFISQLPNSSGPTPISTIPFVPPIIPRGSVPSKTLFTIPIMGGQSHVPPVTQGHHISINPNAIYGPFFINVGSNLPFMARLIFRDLARLTNDPICHQAHWPPMPTKLP